MEKVMMIFTFFQAPVLPNSKLPFGLRINFMDVVLPFWLAAKYNSWKEKSKEKENAYSPYVTFLLRQEFQF